jgi:hypothetical protein
MSMQNSQTILRTKTQIHTKPKAKLLGTEEKPSPELISYCGLYCPDCHAYKGRISDLAIALRKELRRTDYEKFAKFISKYSQGKDLKNFDEAYKVLGAIAAFRCDGCRAGGGSSGCKIKQCAIQQNFEGCWQCSEFERCKKLNVHNLLHGEAHRKNLRTIQKKGKNEILKGNRLWTT